MRDLGLPDFQTIFDASHHFMGVLSPEGILLDANQTALKALGLSLEAVRGRWFWETPWWTHDPVQQKKVKEGIQQARLGEPFQMETTHPVLGGGLLVIDFTIYPLLDPEGRVVALLPEGRDVSDLAREREQLRLSEARFRALLQQAVAKEADLRESERKFRLLFERSVDGLLILDGDRFTDCNQAVLEMMRCTGSEFLRLHPWELSPPIQPDGRPSAEKAMEMIATAYAKGVHRFEWIHRRLDGEDFPVEVTLLPIPLGGKDILFTTWRDITERKKAEQNLLGLERQMLHAQKLESLGVLAGGIAHDFNNLLTAILGNLNLAQSKLPGADPVQSHLKATERAVLKASELTRQMLAYSGKGRFVVKAHDLNQVLRDMTHLVQVSLAKKVTLRFDLEEGLPPVEADAAQIQQVILNLLTNASDAIGEGEGVIRIATYILPLDEADLAAILPRQGLCPGLHVVLEVGDSGSGMTPEIQALIFEPFFSTKPTGHGLGLSAIQGILKGHRAGISIDSNPGHGTTFKLYFPASQEPLSVPQVHAQAPDVAYSGLVLLVDDEKGILEATAQALELLGFEVETASDGQEALERFSARPEAYRLALLDLTMPRMNGRECFQALRSLRPDLRVILCSGFSEQESVKEFLGKGLAGFIQKPYTLDMLRKALTDALRREV